MSPTPSLSDDDVDPAVGAELRRRLDGLAATTVVDPDAWSAFESSLSSLRPVEPGGGHRASRRVVVGVAAATLAITGVAVTVARARDGRATVRTQPGLDETSVPNETSIPEETSTSEELPADPLPRVLTLDAGDYGIELYYDEPRQTIYLRHTLELDNEPTDRPDPTGYNWSSGWGGEVGALSCFASTGGEFRLGDAPVHAFTMGLAPSDITRVDVVMSDGARRSAIFSAPDAHGLRVWLVERPLGTIDRIEARTAEGHIAGTITNFTPGLGDFGESSC